MVHTCAGAGLQHAHILTFPATAVQLMRKNQYEEALFRCEDDRYELDMCIETNSSALRALRPLADRIAQLSGEDKANFRLSDDALSPIHYRAVERIYGEQVTCSRMHMANAQQLFEWLCLQPLYSSLQCKCMPSR